MPDRSLSTELADPKYAQFERERRWLVNPAARPDLEEEAAVLIEDRYLDGCRFRVRKMSRSEEGWTSFKLTKKYETDDPAVRPIVTAYLTAPEHALFNALPGATIAKRRYRVAVGELSWSLDVFEGKLAGLEIVEIEATDDNALAQLAPPPWVVREVTNETRYQCGSLARSQIIPEE